MMFYKVLTIELCSRRVHILGTTPSHVDAFTLQPQCRVKMSDNVAGFTRVAARHGGDIPIKVGINHPDPNGVRTKSVRASGDVPTRWHTAMTKNCRSRSRVGRAYGLSGCQLQRPDVDGTGAPQCG